jgi:hypothetical protein
VDAVFVHNEVGGDPHVDVVERRLGQVQGDVLRPVPGLDLQLIAELLILRELLDEFGRRDVRASVELARFDLVEDVIRVGIDRELEPVGQSLA